MKITCPKERLLIAISNVQGAVSPKTTLPILANVMLEADEGILTFTATDLDIGIQYKVPVDVLSGGATTLPARRLFSIIRELPEGNVEMNVDSNHVASISCGAAHFKVVGMGKEEFPRLPSFPEAKTFDVAQVLLKEMINKISYAMCQDESRYVLNGIYLTAKSNKILAVATDGRRLALVEKHKDAPKGASKSASKGDSSPAPSDIEAIIPAKTVNTLEKLLAVDGVVSVALAKNQIAFKLPNCVLISRLIEGAYPNYKQVIPEDLEQKIGINREELLSAVKRSALISDKTSSVKLNFAPNRLIISANTPDVGESKETININYNGKETEVAFNPNFIIDVLKNLDDQDILFEVSDGVNPGIIRNGPEFLYVIMPMRLA